MGCGLHFKGESSGKASLRKWHFIKELNTVWKPVLGCLWADGGNRQCKGLEAAWVWVSMNQEEDGRRQQGQRGNRGKGCRPWGAL